MRRRSLEGGRRMAWRVLGRWCRPNVETFFTVVLFGVGGTLLVLLWTFEPRSVDQRQAEAEMQRQLVEEFIREKEQLRRELDRLNGIGGTDSGIHVWYGPLKDRPQSDRRDGFGNPRSRDHFDVGGVDAGNDPKPAPEVAPMQITGNSRSPERTARAVVNRRSIALRSAGDRLFDDRTSPINSSDLLNRVRLKLLGDVTPEPEVDRRARRHSDGASQPEVFGSRRWCSVYNTTAEVDEAEESFDCVQLLIKPATTVCLYPDAVDVHVSRHIRADGLWEPHIVRLMQNLLFQNPNLSLIDVGAHVGQYSLLAAVMGRRVVAVEPHRSSVRRLHKAIKINGVENQVVVVENAVSDARGTFQIGVPQDNQGGAHVRRGTGAACDPDGGRCPSDETTTTTILMDDLLEVVDFRRAVLKIDIEGDERHAFFHADRLFDRVHVGYIFMEWMKLRGFYGAEVDDTYDKRLVQRLVDWLTRRGYTAHSLVLFQRLHPDYWYGWPDDIFWQHREADPFM